MDQQARATAPDSHVWLSASAGTGKTQVLSARVFRLLLSGVRPEAILCLTFTKAGAAEMAERINTRLGAWVRMPDAMLRKELFALGEDHLSPALHARARTLFAEVLDAPGGGIRIQTIHSFCQSLLAAFPLEAGLTPGFRPLEAREEAVLAREALAAMLVDAEAAGDRGVLDAVAALSLRLGEGGAEAFLRACAAAPEAMDALPDRIGPWLRERLSLPPGDVETAIAAECAVEWPGLAELARLNADWGTKKGLERADRIAAWLYRGPDDRAATLADLHLVWARKDGEPGSTVKGQVPQADGYPDLAARLFDRCAGLIRMRAQARFADLLAEGLDVGRRYSNGYRAAKRRLGAVDFSDLIRETGRLLQQPGIGEWVRYKLDQGTEHILIDEAQDTNWDQWSIIRAIADEFFAGEGQRAAGTRTLFTVGDYKQAIFGFQGTDPLNFALAHRHFERLAEPDTAIDRDAPQLPFDTLALTHSFRSAEPILTFVDRAIEVLPPGAMGQFSDIQPHGTHVRGPGQVRLWRPVTQGGADEGEEGWVDDATRALAKRIARWLRDEIEAGRVDPGEVLILVRSRGELAALLVARLYEAGVPVAGVDRLRLNAPLAVRDLLAAIRFVLQPDDDLSLASLLVSPLMGWSQEELLAAAVRREGVTLWRHLRDTAPAERIAPLYAMLAHADFTTPHRFIEQILSGPMQGRLRLLERLGEEARDPVEELLSAALQFESLATPSLQRFIDWFDRGEVEVKRDASAPGNAVRVMTAHGAKGLQAPLVILADATSDPDRRPDRGFRWEVEPGIKLPLFRPKKDERGDALTALIQAAGQRELEEHWRLFYVAATRAERELVIAGALGPGTKGEVPRNSWYALSAQAFDALGVAPLAEGAVERSWGADGLAGRARGRVAEDHVPATRSDLPPWVSQPAPAEARPPRPLSPSSLGDDAVADPPPSPAMRDAAARGRLTHALFERLPAVVADRRRMAADRWLARSAGVADADDRLALIEDAMRVIEHPDYADLFAADALAEAPIAAVVDGLVVAGTVDRLLIGPDRVQIVDFKTGRRVPGDADDVPPYHLRQMAAYAAALGVIFPGKTVEAALLYTAGPTLIPLDSALLARHKVALGDPQQSYADALLEPGSTAP
jgi:ATP-dependent helicase/nuclease subunit A